MMFNKNDILSFRRFVQSIVHSPHPINDQPHKRTSSKMYCEDWEIIEICKYLFHSKEVYYGDPPPNRLKNNPLWSKEDIEKKAEDLLVEYKTAEEIIIELKKRRALHGHA